MCGGGGEVASLILGPVQGRRGEWCLHLVYLSPGRVLDETRCRATTRWMWGSEGFRGEDGDGTADGFVVGGEGSTVGVLLLEVFKQASSP